MSAAETVYEFGSSPDEDDDNDGQSGSSSTRHHKYNANTKKSHHHHNHHHHQQASLANHQTTTSIAANTQNLLKSNKTSSTSINQKLNTSFSSKSDNHPLTNSPNPKTTTTTSSATNLNRQTGATGGAGGGGAHSSRATHDVSASDDHLLLNEQYGGGSSNFVGGSISNTSNTSLSSATNSSHGNVSQSGNQSIGSTSQKGIGHQSSSSSQQQNPNFDSNVISERVKNLATQIYQELKRIISRCNYDEDILSGLMPLIVRVLESLDLALIENQQLQVELELCKDDNEQLVIMFEKEKAAKRTIDKKLIESEYAYEEERQQYQQKIESLDNIVKMYELKAKNASDQAIRFEEKEAERKKEYNKLHNRYTDLLKSHCDVVERVRHLVGNAEVSNLSNITVPQQIVASSSDLTAADIQTQHLSKVKLKPDDVDLDKGTSMRIRDTLKSWNAETELTLEDASLVVIEDMLEPHKAADGSSHNESDRATSEPEGEHEKESENDSIAYTSMEKEFRKLIQDNKDLLNTKNALNVVKDDLIAEVDRLTNEVSMYEQAVEQLNTAKDQMKQKVSALDNELRKTKEELQKAKQKIRENNEEGVPYSLRKRFGRAEMAKVLMERNNYKERYMELQDAVRYTELVRANKVETEKRSGLWKFFNNLFGAPPREVLAIGPGGGQTLLAASRNSSPVVSYHGSSVAAIAASDQHSSSIGGNLSSDALQSGAVLGTSIRSINQRLSSNSDMIVLMDSDLNIDRSRAFKDMGGRLNAESSGYIHAYGWSLPASSVKAWTSSGGSPELLTITGSNLAQSAVESLNGSQRDGGQNADISSSRLAGIQVPIPQYCRPLTGDSLGMKIWCATSIDLSGGDNVLEDVKVETAIDAITVTNSEASGSTVNISTSTPIKSNQQQALRMLEQEVSQALGDLRLTDDGAATIPKQRPLIKTTTEVVLSALPISHDIEELSSCVWICSTQHSRSKITIIDIKTKPNELLDSFYVSTFLYCIKSVPGAKSTDLLGLSTSTDDSSDTKTVEDQPKAPLTSNMIQELISTQKGAFYKLVEVDMEAEHRLRQSRMEARKSVSKASPSQETSTPLELSFNEEAKEDIKSKLNQDDAEISRILDNDVSAGIATLQKLNDFVAHTQPQSKQIQQQLDSATADVRPTSNESSGSRGQQDHFYYQPISTRLSTVWMGGRDSVLYIHSAIGQWKDCVACVKLADSILQICHYRGRVFVALADGTLCVFFRNMQSKQWEFSRYLSIDINLLADVTNDLVELAADSCNINFQAKLSTAPEAGRQSQEINEAPEEAATSTPKKSALSTPKTRSKVAGIRCLEIANKNLWIGYRNRVIIVDPITLKLKHTFNVIPQVDNQIRQLISLKDGVFCCLRSDLILRLYSSIKPYQHIQNIDIEPVVTRLISPKTFVISHITAMKVADNTLWIGNAHGIILTIPCKLVPQISEAPIMSKNGEFEESPNSLSIARFVPKCDITNAQISFHGHKDAVKFFISAHNLMLSGGQGYLDFRLDMDDQSKSISDKSHLILWQLPNN